MNVQHTQKTNTSVIVTIVAALVAGLVVGFTFGAVYGSKIPATYNDTLSTTINATNQTEGYLIDNYVETVKADICKTLNHNATAKEECLKL